MISIPTTLPAAKTAAAGSVAHKGAHAKRSLDLFASDETGSSFASLFGQQTAALAQTAQPLAASTSATANVIAQLTAQLKSGTSMATIVDQIAQSVGNAAANQLKGRYSQSDLDRLRTSITQTIAKALSPPSNAPPGTAAEQAAALAARLQQMVESLARDANDEAGQQNELSGNLLDAVSAKDIPAQQKTSGTSSSTQTSGKLDVSSVVSSLLSQALSSLASSTSATATAAQAAVIPVVTAAQSQPAIPSAQTPYAPSSNGTSSVVPSGSIAMSNAPDLLARMLVRAAGADASVNGASASAAAAVGESGQSSSPPTASLLAARFAALLGETAATTVSSSSSGASSQNDASTSGNAGQHAFAQTPSSAPTANTNLAAGLASTPSMASQVQNALSNPSSPASTVDANALIEQLVKGMVMRTDQQGTSEIRLQLQPENLGAVTMKLSVSGSQVSATVIAQNADVRNTLVAGQQDLARSLEGAGLTLTGFSVDVSGGDADQDRPKDQTAGFGRRYTVHEIGGTAASETTADSGTGPPLLGNSSLDLFNYLA